MTRQAHLLALLIASLAAAQPALSQVTGAISGRVLDPSSSAVSGAAVSVRSVETGAVRTVSTDDHGDYRVLSSPLGLIEVKAEKSGFKLAVRTGIHLDVGQEAVVNLQLEVGELTQEITISEEAPVVNTTTSSVAGVVGAREVKELPLNGRSFDNLIALNPGAVNYNLKSAQTSTSDGNTFSVAGRRPGDNLFLMNGVEYMGSSQLAVTPGGASQQLLGIDAIREFNVLTDAYSAEYGKRAGGQVIVVTQSGSNVLHGSVFEFLRNSALDARNFFDQGGVPPFRRNQFGAALGGPVRKDKIFLFGNYEGFRQALALSSVSVVPDASARLGLLPNATTGVLSTATGLNRAILPFMSLWPDPNGPELTVNGIATGTALSYNNPRQSIREDFGTMRGDYILTDRDSLSASYTVDDGYSRSPLADPLFGSYLTLRNQVLSLQETRIVSPQTVNTFTAGYSRAAFNFDPVSFVNFPSSLSFVTGGGPGGIVIGGGNTTTGVAAITSAGPNNAANVWNRRNLFTFTDNVRISRGRHQITAGVWFQRLRDNENTASRQLGQATFTSLATFLQGNVSAFQVVPNPTELGWRSLFGAWYVEDSFKLRPNLTVRIGLRHEFTTGWNEVAGRAANYIPDANGVLQTAPRIASSVFTQNNAKKLFAPRIGIAWDPFGNGKTAIRAAFGTHYSLIDSLSFLVNSLPPYNGAASYAANTPLASIIPIQPGVNPPAGTIFAPQGIQPDAKTPTVQEWNFIVEHQLTTNTAMRVGYVGSFGYHGLLSVDPNTIPAQICNTAAGCVSGGNGAARGSVPQGAQYIPVGVRPNPGLGAGFFWYTEGNSSYNALQTEVTHRLTHGLQFRANYTFSKNLDMNSGLTGAQANNQAQMILDRNNPRRDWGPSALNVKHQSSISANYALPFGQNLHGAAERLLSGWQLNGIATLLSGFPFTPQIGSNRSGDGDTRNPDRPSLNPSFTGPVVTGSVTQWFNPNAFALPTPGTYGNLGRGVYNGPGLAEIDLSLFKNTVLTERLRAQLRAEVFNVMNHANFGTPNAVVFSNGLVNPSAGLITTTVTTARQIQFGLKLIF